MIPTDRKYSREHEWVLLQEGGLALVGISQFAQEQLGDIVYFDLPKPGTKLQQFKKLGEVESVKAVSEVYAPVSGEVVETNRAVVERPELVNQDPFGQGWLLKVRLADPKELDNLMSAQEYEAHIAAAGH